MTTARSGLLTAALAAVILTGGCTVFSEKEYPVKRQYAIDVARSGPRQAKDMAAVKVRRFQVAERFAGTEFVYRTGPVSYQTDFYNEFLVSPAAMITEETRQWLDASGVFSGAIDTSSRIAARFVLEGNITGLYGDLTASDKPLAVLEIQFSLIDDDRSDSGVAFHKTYAAASPLGSAGAEDVAKGYSACLTEILKQLEADLLKARAN